jgi:micrococcal nuclease
MPKVLTILTVVLAITACSSPPAHRATSITRVIDGDTIAVADGMDETRVRLIGVNAPEHDECFGAEAAHALVELLADGPVSLEMDVRATDDYGRVLAYVYAGEHFVNLELVEGGFALAQAYPPNTSHQDELNAAMRAARTHRAGMWSEAACGAPSATVAIGRIVFDPPGPDGESLNAETVAVSAESAAVLDGWTLRDGSSSHRFRFPAGFALPAGQQVTIHTGCGVDTAHDLYWCADGPIWGNAGDTAIIYDETGALVDAVTYPAR